MTFDNTAVQLEGREPGGLATESKTLQEMKRGRVSRVSGEMLRYDE